MKKALIVLCLASVGCSSAPSARQRHEAFEREVSPKQAAFFECTQTYAKLHAQGDTQPVQVGEAAVGSCAIEFRAMREALIDIFMGSVTRDFQHQAQARAEKKAEEIRLDGVRSAAATVLDERSRN